VPTIFLCYSHCDEPWRVRVRDQLEVLHHSIPNLRIWDDHAIELGDKWRDRIYEVIEDHSVGVFLVSATSLTSPFILNQEIPRLQEAVSKRGSRLIALILKSAPWQCVPWLQSVQVYPSGPHPLARLPRPRADEVLCELAREIERLLTRTAAPALPEARIGLPPDAVCVATMPHIDVRLVGRMRELNMLTDAWCDPQARAVSIVGLGGAGKTALVRHWLDDPSSNLPGVERIYGWSFRRHRVSDEDVSVDAFFEHASYWFRGPATQRAERAVPPVQAMLASVNRLAEEIISRRTLLVLDGLDELMNSSDGCIEDVRLRWLIVELSANNHGLCVLTSRVQVEGVRGDSRATRCVWLDGLGVDACCELFQNQGIRGARAELEGAALAFGGHPLSLHLLTGLLRQHGRDATHWRDVGCLGGEPSRGDSAQSIAAEYVRWYEGRIELSVLFLLGLIRQPADRALMAWFRSQRSIAHVTEALERHDDGAWKLALDNLWRAKLLCEDPLTREILDAHSVVREFFGEYLRKTWPEAWNELADRLYQFDHGYRPPEGSVDTAELMHSTMAVPTADGEYGAHDLEGKATAASTPGAFFGLGSSLKAPGRQVFQPGVCAELEPFADGVLQALQGTAFDARRIAFLLGTRPDGFSSLFHSKPPLVSSAIDVLRAAWRRGWIEAVPAGDPQAAGDLTNTVVFAPRKLARGRLACVEVFLQAPPDEVRPADDGARRPRIHSLAMRVERGQDLSVALDLPGVLKSPLARGVVWQGTTARVRFVTFVPMDVPNRHMVGSVTLSVGAAAIGRIDFRVRTGADDEHAQLLLPVGDAAQALPAVSVVEPRAARHWMTILAPSKSKRKRTSTRSVAAMAWRRRALSSA
jgi:hypothetical protein